MPTPTRTRKSEPAPANGAPVEAIEPPTPTLPTAIERLERELADVRADLRSSGPSTRRLQGQERNQAVAHNRELYAREHQILHEAQQLRAELREASFGAVPAIEDAEAAVIDAERRRDALQIELAGIPKRITQAVEADDVDMIADLRSRQDSANLLELKADRDVEAARERDIAAKLASASVDTDADGGEIQALEDQITQLSNRLEALRDEQTGRRNWGSELRARQQEIRRRLTDLDNEMLQRAASRGVRTRLGAGSTGQR